MAAPGPGTVATVPEGPVPPTAADRHPHLADPPPVGHVRVDCHSHTMWSGDCTTTPEELVEAVVAARLDVLCITDHNTLAGAEALASLLPCRVVVGQEVRTHAGEVIGLFLTERVPANLAPDEAARRIRAQGGLVYVPHPFDPARANLRADALDALVAAGLVDVLEVRNAKTAPEARNEAAVAYAARFGLAAGAGSDGHVPDALGAVVVDVPDFDGPAAFLASLGQGRVLGHHFDLPRPWRARIVPSTAS